MKNIKNQKNLKHTNDAKELLLHMLAEDEEKFRAFKSIVNAM